MLLSRPRPRTILVIALATVTAWYLLFSGPSPQLHVVPYPHEHTHSGSGKHFTPSNAPTEGKSEVTHPWDIDIEELADWTDEGDDEDPNDVEPGYETDGQDREPGDISKLQHEKDMRKMWRYAYKVTAK